jgi:hypothetical protein
VSEEEEEKRAPSPDRTPAEAPDAADVTAHSAVDAPKKADWLTGSGDLDELAVKWSHVHGPGVLPGFIPSTGAPTLPATGMQRAGASDRHAKAALPRCKPALFGPGFPTPSPA